MKLTFYGGTGSVTGANFLVEHTDSEGKNIKLLIDCGMMQGTETADDFNKQPFPYNVSEIDYLIITHAHIDHIGRIPKIVRDGFRGRIIATPPTKEITQLLLEDTLAILESNARRNGTVALFAKEDLDKAMTLWDTLPYHELKNLFAGISIYLRDSGHILGASMVEVFDGKTKAVFTGDLGNSPSLLLNDTENLPDANYIVMESVYGDRNHEAKDERKKMLKAIIQDTITHKKVLIIPAFSVERTQMMLYEMDEFFASHELTAIPVFLDSPLAIKVTKIYEKYSSYLNEKVRAEIQAGNDVFKFPKLKNTPMSWESEKIDATPNPKIIMAGSGMSNGGRVVHHERDHAGDANATILLVGYQAVGTLGRQLEDQAKVIKIQGQEIAVKAKIAKIEGYSSHKDSDHLVGFVEEAAKSGKLKKVFTVMGEPKASLFLVQRLRDELNVKAEYPEYGESVELI